MENVVISGGTGLVGSHLVKALKEKNYQVTILSRSYEGEKEGLKYVKWNPAKGELQDSVIEEADHIVNLAGANLGQKRWTESYKKIIVESRIQSTRLLVNKANSVGNRLKTFISTSAINYYGIKRSGTMTEDSGPGNHFLSEVCTQWENEANKLSNQDSRLVILRLATVLANEDGALPQMARPVRFGVGAPLGPGNQHTTWIHIEDLVQMIIHAIESQQVQGVYNASAPESTTNKEMMKTIANKLSKPLFLPNVPMLVLKAMIGEFAEVLLSDLDISVEKIKNTGFEFQYPTIDEALYNLLSKKTKASG